MNLMGKLGGLIDKKANTNWVQNLVDGKFADVAPFSKWLGSSYDLWPLHVLAVEAGAVVSFANSMIGQSMGQPFRKTNSYEGVIGLGYKGLGTILSMGTSLSNSITATANETMSTILKETLQPNIEGIPIQTTRITCSHSADVSDKRVIIQRDMKKSYITDSITVKPREWEIEGYLTSMSIVLDDHAIIKPSLILQVNILDSLMDASKPVLFKDDKNRFFPVLMKGFRHTTVAETENALQVSIALQEFYPYEVEVFQSAEEASSAVSSSIKSIASKVLM